MRKLEKFRGFNSHKYGLSFTPEQRRINDLIDAIKLLEKRVKELENQNRQFIGIE